MSRNSTQGNTQSQQHFAQIPSANIQRSVFDRSSGHKTTFDAGKLIPFFVDEVLPGDTMRLNTSFLARLSTPIFPYMDNVWMDFHFFFVPNRLVWDNWERFCGAQDNPDDTTDYLVPQMDRATYSGDWAYGNLFDYFGFPTNGVTLPAQADSPNSLVARCYNLIWNTWYRDENLQDSVVVDTGDGPDDYADYNLLTRNRRKDYFTSMLPWPQKGTAVALPLGTSAPVKGLGFANLSTTAAGGSVFDNGDTTTTTYAFYKGPMDNSAADKRLYVEQLSSGGATNIRVDLTEATASTLNELREAATLQQLFELDARGGTRFNELLLAHFGVMAPDYRLQRPELLGVGSAPINVNPIAQTSETGATGTPQGNLAAFASSSKSGIGFVKSFVEHGHVIGLVSARADNTYQNGMNKMWTRRTRYDFYWPTFANLGEQAVTKGELFYNTTGNDTVIGYQERWADYRYKPSIVTGLFRSGVSGSLDSWHLAMELDDTITLESLIPEAPPIDRIIAVPTEPHFIFDSFTQIRHARPMPTYSIPGITKL